MSTICNKGYYLLCRQFDVSFCQEDEWQDARECLVRAFHHYPLYSYLIPNDTKRKIFLSRYLDAVYEVTVRQANSVLICVKLRTEMSTSSFTNEVKVCGEIVVELFETRISPKCFN